ncbi:MAG TPA: hypothetical protein VHO67_20510 [Polyangia bacterium]|nr:hypothetical protein [Polyangia bacterium]
MWGSAHHRGAALVVLLGVALAAPPAAGARRYADGADPVAKVTQMNREALAAIDKREFEKAREILKKALELCDSGGLAQHRIAARTHVHMGVVILEGFKNRELGLKQFATALAIEPGIGLTPSLATPELAEAFDEARSSAPGGGSAAEEREAPATHESRRADEDEAGLVAQGQVGPEVDEDDRDEAPSSRWFASLLIGGGFGTTSGHGELNADSAAPGSIAGALLGQLSPEVGYWVSGNLMLSAQGRVQVVTGPTEIDADGRVYSPASWAFALFAKASWFFGVPGGWRPYLSGGLGGGQVRHVVTFGALRDCGPGRNQTCVDTVVAGPALAEVGGGVLFEISRAFGVVAGTNLQLAAPQFTANLDINAGVAFAF